MIRTLILSLVVTFSGVACGQQQMLLRGSAAGGETGILDGYTADAAYCTCWLYSSYSGSLLRVRRDSDNAEQDIGRDGQGLDESALTSFCSGANCFVTTRYDQSGSGRNLTQSTTSNQPKIYDSSTGVLLASNSLPGDDYNVAGRRMQVAFSFSQPATFIAVADAESTYDRYMFIDGYSSSFPFYLGRVGSATYRQYGGVAADYSTAVTGLQMHYAVYNGAASSVSLNGGAPITTSVGSAGSDGVTIGAIRGTPGPVSGSYLFPGKIQAIIIFESDQSANRTAIESALNNYFLIY